jgi:hypothetical protein
MKPIGIRNLMLASMLLLLGPPTLAGETGATKTSPPGREGGDNCHHLMTERECATHKAALALQPAGGARERFLAAHAEDMREREASCSCTHLNAAPAYLYPRVFQVARHF